MDDGERIDFDDYFFAAIQIHATEGGGYYFAPGASPMDGLLSVCIYAEPSKLKMIPMILDAKNKERKEYDTVRYITCRKIRIHTDIPLAVHTDGEVLEKQTEIEIYCEPGRLKMIV